MTISWSTRKPLKKRAHSAESRARPGGVVLLRMPIHWLSVNYLAVSGKQKPAPTTLIGGKWREMNFATSCRGFHLSIICTGRFAADYAEVPEYE
jgi:hypothetical protein